MDSDASISKRRGRLRESKGAQCGSPGPRCLRSELWPGPPRAMVGWSSGQLFVAAASRALGPEA